VSALSSLHRLEQFLCKQEKSESTNLLADDSNLSELREANLGFKLSGTTILSNINVSISLKKLTIIIGPVASGKTTLLHSALSEIDCLQGTAITTQKKAIAYCPQDVFNPGSTMRSNILYHKNFNPEWYQKVLSACALDVDADSFEVGDAQPAEKLSGGQSARVVRFAVVNCLVCG